MQIPDDGIEPPKDYRLVLVTLDERKLEKFYLLKTIINSLRVEEKAHHRGRWAFHRISTTREHHTPRFPAV